MKLSALLIGLMLAVPSGASAKTPFNAKQLANLQGHSLYMTIGGEWVAVYLDTDGKTAYISNSSKITKYSRWSVKSDGSPAQLCIEFDFKNLGNACGPMYSNSDFVWHYKWASSKDTHAFGDWSDGKDGRIVAGEKLADEHEDLKTRGIVPEDLNLLKALYFVFRIAEVCEDTGYHFTQDHLSEMTSLGQAISAMVHDAAEVDKAWAGAVQESDAEINMMAASGRAKTYEACKQRLQWWVLFKEPLKQQYKVVTPVPRNPF